MATAAARVGREPGELRIWFEREFITPLGTRGIVLRTRHETAGMPNAVVDELEQRRLVRAEERAGARWYEHDRFIRAVQDSNREALGLPAEGQRQTKAPRPACALARAERARLAGRLDAARASALSALKAYRASGDRTGEIDVR